jgi:hypothetical protein
MGELSQVAPIISAVLGTVIIVGLIIVAIWLVGGLQSNLHREILGDPASSPLLAAAGTKIICPDTSCNHEIATANRDVFRDEIMDSGAWDGVPYGAETKCPKCRTLYYCELGLHTDKGWL